MSDHRPGPGWGRGSDGQRATAAALTALPADTHFFHGLPIGRTGDEVDHLVVGPTGVWVIGSLRWTGPVTTTPDGMVWLGGTPVSAEVDRMTERAAYARQAMRGEVRPVLCIVGVHLPQPVSRIGGVEVVDVDWLVSIITSQPTVLTEGDTTSAVQAAARWRVQPPEAIRIRWDSGAPAAPAAVPPRSIPSTALPPERSRHHLSPSHVMAAAAVVAVSMLALIGYLLTADRGTVPALTSDVATISGRVVATDVPGYGALRVEVVCAAGGGFELIGHVQAVHDGRVRISATVADEGRYLGEYTSLQRTPTIAVGSVDTVTGFAVQRVDRAGRGGDVSEFEVRTPADPC